MSDDLIARLRDMGIQCCDLAADRLDALEAQVAALTGATTLNPLIKPLADFGIRELGRAACISPTTALRVKRGETDLDGKTLRAVMAVTGQCLCCGRDVQSSIPVAASQTPDPAVNALGAEWMRREASGKAQASAEAARKQLGRAETRQDAHDWAIAVTRADHIGDAILAIPGPTHEQLLADALALEEVRAVVEALRVYADGCDAGETTTCGYEGNMC